MDVGDILAALSVHVADEAGDTDDEKVKAIVATMRSHDSPAVKAIAQRLLDAGAGRKAGEHGKRIKALEVELQESKDAAAELQGQLDGLEATKGKPSEKEAVLERERDRWKAKADKADTDLKAERDGRKTDRVGTKALTVVGKLRGQVDDDYLDEVLTPRIQKRLRPTDEDVEFLAADETPYEGDDKARSEALAADVLKVGPDKYRLRQMQPGGGVNGRGTGNRGVTDQQLDEQLRTRHRFGV